MAPPESAEQALERVRRQARRALAIRQNTLRQSLIMQLGQRGTEEVFLIPVVKDPSQKECGHCASFT